MKKVFNIHLVPNEWAEVGSFSVREDFVILMLSLMLEDIGILVFNIP